MSRRTPTTLIAMAALLQGCTATIAMIRVGETGRAIHDAEDAGAEVNAAFEYTLAQRHFEQAMIEHGDAQYKTAVDLAKIGKMWAEKAKLVATGGTRDINALDRGEDLTDENKRPGSQRPTTEDEDFLDDEDK